MSLDDRRTTDRWTRLLLREASKEACKTITSLDSTFYAIYACAAFGKEKNSFSQIKSSKYPSHRQEDISSLQNEEETSKSLLETAKPYLLHHNKLNQR